MRIKIFSILLLAGLLTGCSSHGSPLVITEGANYAGLNAQGTAFGYHSWTDDGSCPDTLVSAQEKGNILELTTVENPGSCPKELSYKSYSIGPIKNVEKVSINGETPLELYEFLEMP